MNIKIIIIAFIFGLFFSSCKEEKKTVVKNDYSVTIEGVFLKNDNWRILEIFNRFQHAGDFDK